MSCSSFCLVSFPWEIFSVLLDVAIPKGSPEGDISFNDSFSKNVKFSIFFSKKIVPISVVILIVFNNPEVNQHRQEIHKHKIWSVSSERFFLFVSTFVDKSSEESYSSLWSLSVVIVYSILFKKGLKL